MKLVHINLSINILRRWRGRHVRTLIELLMRLDQTQKAVHSMDTREKNAVKKFTMTLTF